jgi:hypothetical protein
VNRFTYKVVEPSTTPPFKTRIAYTRGQFVEITEPIGAFGFRYAVFRNRRSEVLVPVHDLTEETRRAISVTA